MDIKKEVRGDNITDILLKKKLKNAGKLSLKPREKQVFKSQHKQKQSMQASGILAKDIQDAIKEIEIEKTAEYDLKEDITKKGDKITTIDLRIKKVGQLFNSFDPSPFVEKDLDDDASEYIITAVRENSLNTKMRILIHLPKNKKNRTPELEIKQAIHNFFEYKEVIAERAVKKCFQEAKRSFVVGISFLAFCLFSVEAIHKFFFNITSRLFAEVLTIFGWVAMWKPISNVLYDWWPLQQEKKVHHKIAEMEIDFVYE